MRVRVRRPGRVRRPARARRAVVQAVRRLARRHPVGDWLAWFVAVVLSFITFGTSDMIYDVPRFGLGVMPFVGALVGLPFGLVVRRPLTGWVVSVASAALMMLLMPVKDLAGDPWPWHIVHGLVMFGLLFGVCAVERLRIALGAYLVTAALWVASVPPEQAPGWLVAVTGVAVMGWLAGRLARTRVDLRRQTLLGEEERAQRVRLQERARIARDLHDIVAHHMSLIVVQAETAAFRVPDLPASARRELTSIGEAARAALTETRALLSVLRQEDTAAPEAPQPGLEQIEELCAAARRAGADVAARVAPLGERLHPGAALAAYRIVQEALSNAARHAAGAPVVVDVGPGDGAASGPDRDGLVVSVVNGPPPGSAGADPEAGAVGAGHGITGMSERAAAEGGTLTAGRTPDGGFAVHAWLPLDAARAAGRGERG